ncbi:acetamidase/formamidase family protein [Desulfitobacterium sp.]|uniref:acetamidase/formamidase family protein n=1 Tax=Desulfitobacterium sp. TaxID=49981 RepID=UPI002B211E33|nr:acetamidase/formamidase family protein [Desulfitobacterium sp.]MEA4901307.1 acetamidase/formamidase family protein [Desulfitobacterium sp.]
MYRIKRNQIIYAMSALNQPVQRVEDGATVLFETCDCFENQIKSTDTDFETLDWNRINPATGPVYVQGAQPGDILKVTIEKIGIADHGVMMTGPDVGMIGDRLTQNAIRLIPIRDSKAVYEGKVELPLKPMIGVIGTAPAGDPVSCGTPGEHGGNMDCTIIGEGTTLYLPVNVPGALLAMGDLHAVMGDGEVSVCGLEVQGEVTVTVSVLKDCQLPLPLAKTAFSVYVIASANTLDEAVLDATRNLVDLLTTMTHGTFNEYDAINLLSLAGNLQVCQVVDPLKTVRFELNLHYLKQLGITLE